MIDYPGGTWITMEGTTEKTGTALVIIGYKYNKKKVLTFVTTRGAGSTEKGEPYEARFPDKYGNLCVRHVARPDCVSNFFKYSNKVDLHNQSRQFDLALEKKWITQNPYFRLFTTEVGTSVIDAWKVFKNNHREGGKPPSVAEFADIMAHEMLEYAATLSQEAAPPFVRLQVTQPITVPQVDGSQVSMLTEVGAESARYNATCHTRLILPRNKQLRCIWCSRVHLVERKVTMKCKECGVGFCRTGSGRDCWSHHVAMNGIPEAPQKGLKRRLCREVSVAEAADDGDL